MDLSNLCKLSADEILKGSFGIEWESLRAYSDGKLSLTPHPEVFGDKLKNPLITTDFSESQIEIIRIETMAELGRMAGIDIGASAAAE